MSVPIQSNSVPFGRFLWTVALLLGFASPSHAASARDELLKFVPNDVALCVVLQDLRGHAAALEASPLVTEFRASSFGKALAASNEAQHLRKLHNQMQNLLGLDWPSLRDDLLGDAVIFAYRPGPIGKPEQEQGLFLLRARDPKVLAELIERLNRIQQSSGELKSNEEREHNGLKYFRRSDKNNSTYYHVRGPVLVFSSQEDMLRRSLDSERSAADSQASLVRRFNDLGAERALLTIWLNPRPLDADLEAKTRQATGAEAAFLKTFGVYWKALQDAALLIHVDRDLSLSLAVRAKILELPAPAQRLLATMAQPSELWRIFPENALLALAARWDAVALTETIAEFLRPEQRREVRAGLERTVGAALGKDLMREVLPQIGPDWGWCLTAPANDKEWLPRGLIAVKLGGGVGVEPIDQSVLSALNSFALIGVLGHNKQNPVRPVVLKSILQDKREVKVIIGEAGLPPGFQPAYGLKQNFLLLATSPAIIEEFSVKTVPATTGDIPLLRLSFKEWRLYVKNRREVLARLAAERNRISLAEASRGIEGLLAGLQWFDRLEIGIRTSGDVASLTIRVWTDPGLKVVERK